MLLSLIIACFLVVMAAVLTPAKAGEAILNSDIDVDVTGKDAADAREQAMVKAQTDALAALLGKLSTHEQVQHIINNLDSTKISGMVRSTEVSDEKISRNRYRAHMTLTFDADQINSLLTGTNVSQTQQAPPVGAFLIIPSYEEDGVSMLWEDGNPWRNAWKTTGLEVTSGDIVVPFGDNNDASIVEAKTLSSANYSALLPLTIRYGVSDIAVLQAKLTHAPDMELTVVKRRISRTQNEVNLLTYRADPQETKETLLARAAHDIADSLEHKKSEEMEASKTVQGGERNTVMLLASISTLSSWTQLRSKLSTLPMIDRLEILAISPQQVDMIVHYRGTPDSLANAINSQNIRLVQNPNYWVVSRD